MFDLYARLQPVVQEVWGLYFSGLAAWSSLCLADVAAVDQCPPGPALVIVRSRREEVQVREASTAGEGS